MIDVRFKMAVRHCVFNKSHIFVSLRIPFSVLLLLLLHGRTLKVLTPRLRSRAILCNFAVRRRITDDIVVVAGRRRGGLLK